MAIVTSKSLKWITALVTTCDAKITSSLIFFHRHDINWAIPAEANILMFDARMKVFFEYPNWAVGMKM
jgi:hypothetical protein